jgi:hypothetical protein
MPTYQETNKAEDNAHREGLSQLAKLPAGGAIKYPGSVDGQVDDEGRENTPEKQYSCGDESYSKASGNSHGEFLSCGFRMYGQQHSGQSHLPPAAGKLQHQMAVGLARSLAYQCVRAL